MAGVTDTVFRRFIRNLGGCGLIMTEFTSAEGLTRNSARALHYLYFDADEHPIAAQIFGSDPQVMASAAALRRSVNPVLSGSFMGPSMAMWLAVPQTANRPARQYPAGR